MPFGLISAQKRRPTTIPLLEPTEQPRPLNLQAMQNLLLVKPQHSPLMLNDGAENSSCLLSPYYVPSALQQFREAVRW